MSKEGSLKIMSVKFENEKSIRTINISLEITFGSIPRSMEFFLVFL